MKVAILAPMRQELAPVVKACSLRQSTVGDTVVHTGRIGDTRVVATMTGIGMTGARRATEQLLERDAVDHVMVVGIAGGVGPTVRVGDLVHPEVVIDEAAGTEHRPAHLGAPAARGTLVSSDEFHVDPEKVAELTAAGVIALDMETAAVAGVCESRGCPWSVIRAISDLTTDHHDDSILGLARPDGSANGPAVAKFLLTRPWQIPKLARLQRGSQLAATAAAHAAARACRGT